MQVGHMLVVCGFGGLGIYWECRIGGQGAVAKSGGRTPRCCEGPVAVRERYRNRAWGVTSRGSTAGQRIGHYGERSSLVHSRSATNTTTCLPCMISPRSGSRALLLQLWSFERSCRQLRFGNGGGCKKLGGRMSTAAQLQVKTIWCGLDTIGEINSEGAGLVWCCRHCNVDRGFHWHICLPKAPEPVELWWL